MCKVKDGEEPSRKKGMLENKQGEMILEGLEAILSSFPTFSQELGKPFLGPK